MPSSQSFKFAVFILLTLAMSCFSALITAAEQPVENGQPVKLLQPGTAAPACLLKGIDGKEYSFPTPGHWNMVFYWSLFCHSCLEEIPAVQGRIQSMNVPDLKTFFVALDSERMIKALQNFSSKRDLKLPVLMEQLASNTYVTADQWGVVMTPSVFIVAPDGKVAYSHQGPMDIEEFFAGYTAMSATAKVASSTER